jgi:HAD superfamily hydrolase (TIGR01509 family)
MFCRNQGVPAVIQPDLVIFDCDGVLVDSEVLSCGCLCEALGRHGIDLPVDEAIDLFVGRSMVAVREHFRTLGRALPDEFAVDLKEHVREVFAKALLPIDGIASVLGDLRSPTCVASSSDLDRVSFSLEVTGLSKYFGDRIYTSQMVKHGKPAPDLFLYAASAMQAEPEHTLVIEDSVSGVRAARAAGMTVWGFVGGSHYASRDGRAILQAAGADRIFADMSEFWPQGVDATDGRA